MIYEQPKYSPGGDRYMLIEFGDEMNLDLNFMGQGLAVALEENPVAGVIETAPCFATMLIHYDPELITYDDLQREVSTMIGSLGGSDDIEMDSRLFYFQTLYLDPGARSASMTTARRSIRTRSKIRNSSRGSTVSTTSINSCVFIQERNTGQRVSASGRAFRS